jgi:hypothetical protein
MLNIIELNGKENVSLISYNPNKRGLLSFPLYLLEDVSLRQA